MSTLLFVLFWVVLGLTIVLLAMRSGRRGPFMNPESRAGRRATIVLTVLAVVLLGLAVPVAVGIAGNGTEKEPGSVALSKADMQGREQFSRNCAQCHTLEAAKAVGRVGPNLDDLRPPKALIVDAIDKGRARGRGQMPAQVIEGPDVQKVAGYVAKVAGRD